jgi:opacity protein-like surface antigen
MTNGQVGLEGASRDVTLFTGDAGLQFAITRNLALDASYYRFYYNFDTGVLLPGQLAPRLDRNGVRVGLTLFLPLVY